VFWGDKYQSPDNTIQIFGFDVSLVYLAFGFYIGLVAILLSFAPERSERFLEVAPYSDYIDPERRNFVFAGIITAGISLLVSLLVTAKYSHKFTKGKPATKSSQETHQDDD
jgi:hypothetical protein